MVILADVTWKSFANAAFNVKKEKMDMCLLESECAQRLKAHTRAIPGFYNNPTRLIVDLPEFGYHNCGRNEISFSHVFFCK